MVISIEFVKIPGFLLFSELFDAFRFFSKHFHASFSNFQVRINRFSVNFSHEHISRLVECFDLFIRFVYILAIALTLILRNISQESRKNSREDCSVSVDGLGIVMHPTHI